MRTMLFPISILDLAFIGEGHTAKDALNDCVALAQQAERFAYARIWYAEHHNFSSIASSATSVVIAHVAAHTKTIRLGAGGIMLPNHSPLVIAEQFGTLESLHPGRIDLGLGRAPGTDPTTSRALRTEAAVDSFPEDVRELQGFLGSESLIAGVNAIPGKGTHVPIYMLGSSLFGASLAAAYGLPFAFASHFAPSALKEAVATYRRTFKPSAQLKAPYVIAGVNVIAADSEKDAQHHFHLTKRMRIKALLGRGRGWTDEQADEVLASPAGQMIEDMCTYSAVGTAGAVRLYLERFRALADADELITVHSTATADARLRSVELLAECMA